MSRIFGPLGKDHPLLLDHQHCVLCDKPFVVGDRTTLIPALIPGIEGDETGYYDRLKVDGRWQTVECCPVHADCAERNIKTQGEEFTV